MRTIAAMILMAIFTGLSCPLHAVLRRCPVVFSRGRSPDLIGLRLRRLQAEPRISWALDQLRQRYRTGWQRRGIPDAIGETILDHSEKLYHAARIMSLPTEVDRERLALMLYFHDIAEYSLPDFTPYDPISPAEKHALEREVVADLVDGAGAAGAFIERLYAEYADQRTFTSQLASQLDKLDAGVQALKYRSLGFNVDEFFPYTRAKLTLSPLQRVFEELLQEDVPHRSYYERYFEGLQQMQWESLAPVPSEITGKSMQRSS